ncbi:YusW family protein [Paenisporosarcina quisquiliarum]|uniref:YusW family protein n=1 Tax=Paenisporosarcina quisquiliarum TaxID=365346 RepID=UPI00373642A5
MAKLMKALLPSAFLISIILLGACANDDEVTNDTTNNNTADDIEDTETGENPANVVGESFDFKGIDIEIDVADQEDAIIVHYEEKKDATDVQYKNTLTNEDVQGSDAMTLLEPIFEKLSIAESHTNEEVVRQLAEGFGVADKYTELKAEITFFNEHKQAYEGKK